jgi:molecular chaperone DnaK
MIREAEQFNEQDKRAKEEAEIRNTADSVIYTTEKTLVEIGDKLSQEQKAKIQQALQSLNGALKTGGLAEISSKVEELRRVVQEAGTTVYQQAASQRAQEKASQEAPPPAEEQREKKTVEAEYRVVDEDKK